MKNEKNRSTILLLAANPCDTAKIRWEAEINAVREGLRNTDFRLEAVPQAGISGLQKEFTACKPRIVHFCGHGENDGLIFNDEHGQACQVPAAALTDLFRLFKDSVQCVVLNACWTEEQAGAIHEYIPVVVGMNHMVEDRAALEFAAGFYQALGDGRAYREAFGFGRNNIHLHGGDQHLAPVLLCRDEALTPRVFINPYRGLAAFRQADADLFFGREREIAALSELVARQNFLVLAGVSGSGKSSVVFAGLAPRLGDDWQVVECRPENNPFNRLALAFVRVLYADKVEQAARLSKLEKGLRNGEVSLPALVQIWRASSPVSERNADAAPNVPAQATNPRRRILLIIDQFEELYTAEPVQHAFLDLLLALVSSDVPATLLLTLRADFVNQALTYPDFAAALNGHTRFIGAMNREELREVIEKPARQAGLALEEELSARILDDVGLEPGRLPLLQFALTELCERHQQGRLTHAGYQAAGGVEQALACYAEDRFQQFPQHAQLQRVFVQLVHPGQGTEDTRRVATREQLAEHWDLVRELADQRLVVTGRDEEKQQDTAEVIHEALLRHWQRLRQWMKEDRSFRVWQDEFQADLAHWHTHGEKRADLPRGAKLAKAGEMLETRAEDLSVKEKNFIQQAQGEQKRQQRVWMGIFGLLLALLGVAAWQWWEAEVQKTEAVSARQMAEKQTGVAEQEKVRALEARQQALRTQSLFLADLAQQRVKQNKPATAMRLALEALPGLGEVDTDRGLVPQARQALYDATLKHWLGVLEYDSPVHAVQYSPDGILLAAASGTRVYLWDTHRLILRSTLTGHTNWINSVAFSPNGKTLATGARDKTARLWDMANGREIRTLIGHTNDINSVAFSPNGKTLATGAEDNTARLWDTASGRELHALTVHASNVNSVAFSPDGKNLATGSGDSSVRLWDVASGREIRALTGHTMDVMSVAFSLGGKILATGSWDNTARLWDAASGHEIYVFTGHTELVNSVAFSPDGKILATGSWDNTARLWDTASGREIHAFTGHTETVLSVAFSPDGKTLATSSDDNSVRLWDAMSGHEIHKFTGHINEIWSVAFSPDGKTLATGSDDNSVRLWDAASGREIHALTGHASRVWSVAFSPDGKTLVTGSWDNTARLWDAASGHKIRAFTGHSESVYSVAFSPDGKILATGSGDKSVRLWDAASGHEIRAFTGHTESVYSMTFSPDGKILVTGSEDKSTRLWDVASGREILAFTGHTGLVSSVAFSPDGKILATGSWDESARLWDVASGHEILSFTGHTELISSVAFSPDGKILATSSWDNTARLWKMGAGRLEGTESSKYRKIVPILWFIELRGHTDFVHSVAFSPDGQWLATASTDKTVRLWPVFTKLEEMVDYARQVLPPRQVKGEENLPGYRLSCAERKRFFLDVERVGRCKSTDNEQ
ncbi:MAG: AAA family ATPase [Gammaproteobacteria bacterium]|nr:AAA family ATPase [Gammaproteobacteria bacterium]